MNASNRFFSATTETLLYSFYDLIPTANSYVKAKDEKVNIFVDRIKVGKNCRFIQFAKAEERVILKMVKELKICYFKIVNSANDADLLIKINTSHTNIKNDGRRRILLIQWEMTDVAKAIINRGAHVSSAYYSNICALIESHEKGVQLCEKPGSILYTSEFSETCAKLLIYKGIIFLNNADASVPEEKPLTEEQIKENKKYLIKWFICNLILFAIFLFFALKK